MASKERKNSRIKAWSTLVVNAAENQAICIAFSKFKAIEDSVKNYVKYVGIKKLEAVTLFF